MSLLNPRPRFGVAFLLLATSLCESAACKVIEKDPGPVDYCESGSTYL